MNKLHIALLSAFLTTANAEAAPQYPGTVTMKLPHGSKSISCRALGPNRELTREFLLQMHDHEDAYTIAASKVEEWTAAHSAKMINHLTAHGLKKDEIVKTMQSCGVSGVRYRDAPHLAY